MCEKLENYNTENVQNDIINHENVVDDIRQQSNSEQTSVSVEMKRPISSIISTFSNIISGIFFKSTLKEKGWTFVSSLCLLKVHFFFNLGNTVPAA